VDALGPLLDQFGTEREVRIILFTLDESTYSRELAPLAGHYPCLMAWSSLVVSRQSGGNDAFPPRPVRRNAQSRAARSMLAPAQERRSTDDATPIRLGLVSYTFRNFNRAQMIGFMKQLNVFALNAKDVKDHLPMDPQQEAAALAVRLDHVSTGLNLVKILSCS